MAHIGFYLSVVEADAHLANRLIGQLKNHHPESRVLIIGDGDVDERRLDLNQNCCFCSGEHLKRTAMLGRFTRRNFQLALQELDSPWIVKLDPDSYLKRSIRGLPMADWGGQIRGREMPWGPTRWVRGGGWAMNRSAMLKILSSNLLMHPRYHYPIEVERRHGIVYANCRLGHVATQLNLTMSKWSEAAMFDAPIISASVPHVGTEAAIIHPVKSL